MAGPDLLLNTMKVKGKVDLREEVRVDVVLEGSDSKTSGDVKHD